MRRVSQISTADRLRSVITLGAESSGSTAGVPPVGGTDHRYVVTRAIADAWPSAPMATLSATAVPRPIRTGVAS